MSVCFWDKDRENKIKCSYIEGNGITVTAEYDISDEVESVNGMKIWSTTTKINNRNILIADPENHCYILAIDAYYAGNSSRYGSLDDIETTVFKSDSYLKSSSLEDIYNVASDTSFTKIRVYSKEITRHYGNSSVTLTKSEDETIIEMKNKTEPIKALIETNGIKEVCIGDFWSYQRNERISIDIQISGYIDLLLRKRESIENCYKYLKELAIYLQLFKPGKFEFEKVQLLIGENLIDYNIEFDEFSYQKTISENSVKVSLLDFLSSCYKSIPYRDGKEEIRNIPYIINHRYRSIEDNFLSCFRFIECYYKRTTKLDKSRPIIEKALKDYPQDISTYSTLGSTDYIEEIVALRNQYVHSGFYLKNYSLEIKNSKGVIKRVVNNIDGHWLYERTQLLYKVAIDIIFKSMLGYSTYAYK